MRGMRILSMILAVARNRLMGLQFLPTEWSLPCLGRGTTLDFLQIVGLMPVLRGVAQVFNGERS